MLLLFLIPSRNLYIPMLAEAVGFEPTHHFHDLPDFQSSLFILLSTPPKELAVEIGFEPMERINVL